MTIIYAFIQKFYISIVTLIFLCFLSVLSPYAIAEEGAPIDHNQEDKTVEAVFESFGQNVHRFELDNGLRVVFFKRGVSPIFAAQLWAKVGGVDEKTGNTGLAHFLEHMAFKGTKTIGTRDYDKELLLLKRLEELIHSDSQVDPSEIEAVYSKLAALWKDNEFSQLYKEKGAVGLNAGTGKDFTYYTVQLPNTAFEFWCWMESDRLLNPVFRQFYKEREVIREERRYRTDDSPSGKLYEQLLATAFLSHPNRLPVIGWPSDMEQLSRDKMKEFYHTYYRPDNLVLSIVGDLELEQVKSLTNKYFSRLSSRKDPLPQIKTREEVQKGPRSVQVEFDAKPRLLLAYHKPAYPNKDDLHFAILHSLLSDGTSSVLHKELVLEKRLATDVFTTEAPGERYPSLFVVGATPREGVSTDVLMKEIQNILDRYKSTLVKQSIIDEAKRRVRISFLEDLRSNSGIAYIIGKNESLWGDWQTLFKMYEGMLSTTQKDIQRLAINYLNIKNRTDARIVPKGSLDEGVGCSDN